jgi:cytochrome P450
MATSSSIPLVPGLPIVGHLLEFRNHRLELQTRVARQYGGLARLRMGMATPVLVSSAEIAHEVLVEQADAFGKAPGLAVFAKPLLGEGLLTTSEHEHHRRQRRMIAPVFVQKRIAQYAGVMTERAERLAARLRDGEEIDVSEQMMRLTLEIVGKTLFDAEVGADAEQVGVALTEVMEYVIGSVTSLLPIPPAIPTRKNRRIRRTVARLDEVIFRLIRERREGGEDRGDLLSMLVAARDEEDPARRMDDRQVRDEAMTIFLAGHETTANALAWSLYLLAGHPAAYDRLLEEVDAALGDRPPALADLSRLPYTLAVLKESMRLYPPAFMVGRRALRDVTLGGHRVPRKTILLVNIYGMHHSADHFHNPDAFDPGRFLGEAEKRIPRGAYLPFGAGPRVCIGNHFALMEGHLILAALGRRVRFDLVPGQEIVPQALMTLRPRHGIRMRVRRRDPPAAAIQPSTPAAEGPVAPPG